MKLRRSFRQIGRKRVREGNGPLYRIFLKQTSCIRGQKKTQLKCKRYTMKQADAYAVVYIKVQCLLPGNAKRIIKTRTF